MKARLLLAIAFLLLVLGGGLTLVGILGFAGRYDIDADRKGMAVVGLMYGLGGVLLVAGGWRLFKLGRHT